MADPVWKVIAQFGSGFITVSSTHSAPDEDAAIDLLKSAYPMNYGNADYVRAYQITREEAMAFRQSCSATASVFENNDMGRK